MESKLSNVDGPLALGGRNRSDEDELWRVRDDNPNAREELVIRYQPLARKMAMKYQRGDESPDDLIQVAMVGLLNAVNRYHPAGGSKFASFAAPTIGGEIKRYFRDRIWLVRVPRNVQEEIYAVDEAMSELSAELRRTPTRSEIQDRANVEEGGVDRAIQGRTSRQVRSMDSREHQDDVDLNEMIGTADRRFDDFECTEDVNRAMAELDDFAKRVLRLRFDEEMTQSEIAERMDCSQMHVSRVIKRSLALIQADLEMDGVS